MAFYAAFNHSKKEEEEEKKAAIALTESRDCAGPRSSSLPESGLGCYEDA